MQLCYNSSGHCVTVAGQTDLTTLLGPEYATLLYQTGISQMWLSPETRRRTRQYKGHMGYVSAPHLSWCCCCHSPGCQNLSQCTGWGPGHAQHETLCWPQCLAHNWLHPCLQCCCRCCHFHGAGCLSPGCRSPGCLSQCQYRMSHDQCHGQYRGPAHIETPCWHQCLGYSSWRSQLWSLCCGCHSSGCLNQCLCRMSHGQCRGQCRGLAHSETPCWRQCLGHSSWRSQLWSLCCGCHSSGCLQNRDANEMQVKCSEAALTQSVIDFVTTDTLRDCTVGPDGHAHDGTHTLDTRSFNM